MSRKEKKKNTSYEVRIGHYIVGNLGIYKVVEFLGEGSFGKVAKCIKLNSQEVYAVKIMKSDRAGQKEVHSMALIKHLDPEEDHLIRMYECFSFQKMICIVYENLSESLFDFLCKTPDVVDIYYIRSFARDLLKALKALKSIGVAHCDIKHDNILFTDPNSIHLKLIDFGMATEVKDLTTGTNIQVTPFQSPEVILGLPLDEGVDMWALGMVLAVLYYGEYPFPVETQYDTIRAMVQIQGLPEAEMIRKARFKKGFFTKNKGNWRLCTPEEYTLATGKQVEKKIHQTKLDEIAQTHRRLFVNYNDDDHKAFIDLLKRMLDINPKNRITPSQGLEHDFITMKHLSGKNNAADAMLMGMIQPSNPSPSSCGSLSTKTSVSSTHSDLRRSPGEIVSLSLKTSSSSTHSNLRLSPGEIVRLSPMTPVSGSSDEIITDMKEVPSSRTKDEQSTHLSLKCSSCEKPMSQKKMKKNEDLKKDSSEVKKPKDKKKKKKGVVKTGHLLVGNYGVYKIDELLGKGSYGQVFKCCKVGTEDFFAIKIITDVEEGKEEFEAMTLIKDLEPDEHNLIKLYEYFSYRNVTCLVYEILDQSLHNCLDSPSHLFYIRVVAAQMFQALNALKSIGVVHGDIKPDNIMFAEEESARIKLIDFGFARKANELIQGTKIQVTPFRAPEVILGLPLNESIDMWAFGVVLAMLYCGDYPFSYETEYETIRAMVQVFGLPDEELLESGLFTEDFFKWEVDGNDPGCRLLTPDEYTQDTGEQVEDEDHVLDFDAMTAAQKDLFNDHNKEDHRVFIDLLKRMLEVNPQKRITPSEALAHDFITMKHLSGKTKAKYANKAKEIMKEVGLAPLLFKSKRK